MTQKLSYRILLSVSAMILLISCVLSGAFTRAIADSEPSNILLHKTGAKVAAPESDYRMYTRYGLYGSENTSSAIAKLTDGTTDTNKAGASKLQYLNTTTLKIGVMYELGGLYDISGAKLYLPNDAVFGTDLLRGVEVYAGTDPTTLCKPENRIGSVAGNSEKIITISADTPRQAQYAVVLFTDYGGENNVYVSEIELYGVQSSEQISEVNRNLARGLTPEIKLTDSAFTAMINGSAGGGLTDGLFPNTMTQINGNGQYSTHVVLFDLGSANDITRVHVPYYLDSSPVSSWDVYLSDSNGDLLTEANRIAGKTSDKLRVMTAEFAPKSARYAAIVLQAPAGVYITQLFEIEIYGKESSQGPDPQLPAENILLNNTGTKVAAPELNYSMYTRYGMFNSEKTSSAVAKLTDGTTDTNKANASRLQYLNTTTLKIGVMYELGGLYDISGAKLYLPNDAVFGTDLLRGVEVYAGTDPATLCRPENRIGSVAGNSEKTITISAGVPRTAQYAVILFTDYGGENNVYVSEIELYGAESSEQVSGVNRNLARGLTPEIKLTGQELTPLVNGNTSGIAGFTDGLFPDTQTQIYGDQGGGGQYSTHVVWFDLGGIYDISRVHVPYYLFDGAAALLSSWDVYLSDSSKDLLTAGNRIAGKTASQLRVMTAEFTTKPARYAAIVLQAPVDAYITKVYEIEIYGKELSPGNIINATGEEGALTLARTSALPGEKITVGLNPGYFPKGGMLYYTIGESGTSYPLYKRVGSKVYENRQGDNNREDDEPEFFFEMPLGGDVYIRTEFISLSFEEKEDAMENSDSVLGVFGVSYKDASDTGGAGIQFGTRVYKSITIKGSVYNVCESGTILMRYENYEDAQSKVLAKQENQSWLTWLQNLSAENTGLEENEQQIYRVSYADVKTKLLMDRCKSHIDYAARIVNFSEGHYSAQYTAVAYAVFKNDAGDTITLESSDISKVVTYAQIAKLN